MSGDTRSWKCAISPGSSIAFSATHSTSVALELVELRREVIEAVHQVGDGGDRRMRAALAWLRAAELGLQAREALLDRLVRRGPAADRLVGALDLLEAARGLLAAAVAIGVMELAQLAIRVEHHGVRGAVGDGEDAVRIGLHDRTRYSVA